MPDFSKNLFDFYKFLSPADNVGKFTIDSRIGGNVNNKERKPISQIASDRIKETIIENFTPGIIKNPSNKDSEKKGLIVKTNYDPAKRDVYVEQFIQAVRGIYNVVYQACNSDGAEFLYTGYFADYPKPAPPKQNTTNPAKPKPAGGKAAQSATPPAESSAAPEAPPKVDRPAKNFWADVCGEKTGRPPIDFSMIFLRAPMLSRAVSNTDLIQLYLTTMPPIFANQLMPYCDVEFQLPGLSRPQDEPDRVNRPSLYRFLMGSGQDMSMLTEADKSIANVLSANQNKKNFPDASKSQTFFGMEMFTSPQTLVNMDAISANSQIDAKRGARLNDAKPFLPPATLKDVGITVQNAGARTFGRRTASIKLHVHDRKRLVEMAEFLRGSDGYAKSTVWITYGMLAPRGRGDDDAYAKFINENMLVREAFVISNVQFSFTQDGGCEVTLTLSGKGGRRGLTTAITFDKIASLKRSLDNTIAEIKNNVAAFGGERSEKLGFSQKEIRMAQFISSAAEGNIPTSEEEVKKIQVEINEVKQLLDTSLSRGPDFNKEEAKILLDKLLLAIQTRNTTLKSTAKNFVEEKINGFNENKDPFFPDARKNDYNNHNAVTDIKEIKDCIAEAVKGQGINYYDKDLCDAVSPRENYVSLGRIFSSLCVPAMLYALSDEFNWNEAKKDTEGGCPYEVQFIFYQLNNRCGPVSSHNIAEFPMSKALFVDGFLKLIESTLGGDAITLEQMVEFINEQLQDPRQPGYGRSTFYKPFGAPDSKDAQKLEPKEDEKKFSNAIQEWSKKYGDFTTPDLTFEIEVGSTSLNSTGSTARDLLLDLAGKVAAGYTEPAVKRAGGEKTIIKIHVYDRTCSPLDKITKSLRLASDGTYYLVSSEYAGNEEFLRGLENKQLPKGAETSGKEIKLNGETVAVNIGQGKDALMEYLGQMVPRLVIGTEGSLISQVNLQSKTSGLEGTIALQKGVQKRESSIASTGLSQQQFNLPMVLYPAQLTMNSVGCPIAAMGQHFFIDFGTNTTLDNDYVVTQVSHALSPGKFETTWQLCYYDGYGRMISDNDIESQLKSIKKSLEEAEAEKAKQNAPKPPSTTPKR